MASTKVVQWPLSMEENIRMVSLDYVSWRHAGGDDSSEELAALGLLTFTKGSGNGASTSGGETTGMMLGQSLVPVGPGFPALPRKLVERIRSNEYVDFMELPPAKGRSRPLAQAAEGQIVVVQVADMTSSRNVATVLWPLRCGVGPTTAPLGSRANGLSRHNR